MSMLSGFKAFNFNEGAPYVSITPNGVTFNKSVVMKLDYPEHAVLLIDESSGRDLLNTIQSMMNWNLKEVAFRVEGVFLKEERAVLFDLNTATELK